MCGCHEKKKAQMPTEKSLNIWGMYSDKIENATTNLNTHLISEICF